MEELSYAQIQDLLFHADTSELSELRIAVLRNIVLEPIEPYLEYFAFKIGLQAKILFGDYDNIFQEAVGGNNRLLNQELDCVLIFTKLETLAWDLARNFGGLSPKQVEAEVEGMRDMISEVLSGIRRQTDAMILWHGFEFPINPSFGIWDSQLNNGQMATIQILNEFLRSKLNETPNSYFVDLNLCLSRIGARNFYDVRYWHIGRAPYRREALYEIAFEDFKFIRPLKGKNKKCLVLDCDNTLWGGIIGEDGLSGIKLGKTYPGSSYYELQQEIIGLYNRGIIIALCSKNNEQDIWEVFKKHPDMVLTKEHIATAQINWEDKATNLCKIADHLNIGLDSIVFMDDSEFEINLIHTMLPEVETIHLPEDRAVQYRDILASCGLFDTLTVSEEDKKRGAMYKAEAKRKKLQYQITDLESYYRSLEMIVEIAFADKYSIPRIAQLMQKTNQFNCTTKRYSEADINEFAKSDNADVISLRLKDRFGDSGTVGVCILRYDNGEATIDTFLLSCRVLGRGVEDALLVQVLKLAKLRGSRVAIGEYFATRKNHQVKDFYPKQGFKKVVETHEVGRFVIELDSFCRKEPDFFKLVDSEIDELQGE